MPCCSPSPPSTWFRGATATDASTLDAHDGDLDAAASVTIAIEPCWGSGAGAVLVRRLQTTPD